MRKTIHVSRRGNAATERSLDPALDFTRLLWTIEHLLNRTSKLLHRHEGITGPQRLVLRIVQEQPGVSAGEIARLMHVDKSTLTGVFRRLEQRRLLVRHVHGSDRRRASFELGSAARRVGLDSVPTLEAAIQAVFAQSPSARLRTARDVLSAVCNRLESQLAEAARGATRRRGRKRARLN
jgi:DNA-binding MarR family transcriptional regulator